MTDEQAARPLPPIGSVDVDAATYQQIARAAQAQELLEHPLLREAFDTLRERVTSQLFDAPMRDQEGRERLWLMRKCLDGVEGHLVSLVKTGQMAQEAREQRRSLMQRLRDWSPL